MTAQLGDRIVIDGQSYRLGCEPGLPAHPRIVERTPEEAYASNPRTAATSCRRGYVSEWLIEDGRLYLTGVTGRFRLLDGPPLFADWVSQTLLVPVGKIVEYVHQGYLTRTEGRLELQVFGGLVRDMLMSSAEIRATLPEPAERSIAEALIRPKAGDPPQ